MYRLLRVLPVLLALSLLACSNTSGGVSSEAGEETGEGLGFEGGGATGAEATGGETSAGEDAGEETGFIGGSSGDETGVESGAEETDTGQEFSSEESGEGFESGESTEESGEETGSPGVPGESALQATPAEWSFSYVSPLDGYLLKQVTFSNVGSAPLTVLSMGFAPGASQDFFIVAIPPLPKILAPGQSTFVNVRFMETMGGTGTLRVETSSELTPTVDVEFSSYVKAFIDTPDPCIALNPAQLNFGTVVRGETKVMDTVVTNCSSTEALSVTQIQRSTSFFGSLSDEFQMVNEPSTPLEIQAGSTLPIQVSYSPKLAGPDSGSFIFHSNDPGEPQAHLDVSGIGVEPPPEQVGLTVKITWDQDLCDVDSHLIAPGGSFFDCELDCHYGNPAPDWGISGDWLDDPFLDVDDVDGYGPEHINISEPTPGATYRFLVHYYLDSYEDGFFGNGSSVSTNVTVEVLNYGVTVATFGPEYLDTTNRNWDVFELEWVDSLTPPIVTPNGTTYMVSGSDVKSCGGFLFP